MESTESSHDGLEPAQHGEEKRKSPRRKVKWPAQFAVRGKNMHKCQTLDVSEGGLSIQCHMSIPKGKPIFLHVNAIHKGNKHFFKCIGIVRHQAMNSEGYNTGIAFKTIEEEDRSFIRAYANEYNG